MVATLTEAEEQALSAGLLRQLSQTRYACSSLTRLSGGSANFVYRGTLAQPLSSAEGYPVLTKTVIVKHSTGFLPVNRDFAIDVTRCLYEVYMLEALADFSFTHPTARVRAPRLYLFLRETNTQIHEDLSNAADLKVVLLASSPTADNSMSSPVPSPIGLGRDIGAWLRRFHTWASAPAQATLRATVGQNAPMRKLKHLVNFGTLIGILQNFPDVVGGSENWKALHDVKAMGDEELEKQPTEGEENWGLIHGDFYPLNILRSNNPERAHQDAAGVGGDLFIIDWELAQFGHRAYDLGHMIGDLYEKAQLNDADVFMACMRGFVEGYGGFSDELAFRTAIQVGTHLIGGYNRRPKRGTVTEAMTVNLMRAGTDFVLKGWEKDREWFEGSPLAPMFRIK